jgi:hypothetical protein
MGFDFTVTVSGATSKTVSSGQTASYTLVITPLNGSQGAFTFQCGTLPANALCVFNPTTETLGTGVTGNVAVEISTGQSGASATVVPVRWRLLSLACGLVLLPLGWKRRRTALLLAALLAILAGGASSCSGSGGGSSSSTKTTSSPGSTPTGTYSIPVTVLSNGVQHNMTLTLIVD